MEKVTVRKIFSDKLVTKYGPSTKTSIYTEEHPETRMSSFDEAASSIKIGDVVEITIEQKGQFTNFKMGGGAKKAWGGSTTTGPTVEARLKRLEDSVFGSKEAEEKVVDISASDEDF